jgi:hypothetical protein
MSVLTALDTVHVDDMDLVQHRQFQNTIANKLLIDTAPSNPNEPTPSVPAVRCQNRTLPEKPIALPSQKEPASPALLSIQSNYVLAGVESAIPIQGNIPIK